MALDGSRWQKKILLRYCSHAGHAEPTMRQQPFILLVNDDTDPFICLFSLQHVAQSSFFISTQHQCAWYFSEFISSCWLTDLFIISAMDTLAIFFFHQVVLSFWINLISSGLFFLCIYYQHHIDQSFFFHSIERSFFFGINTTSSESEQSFFFVSTINAILSDPFFCVNTRLIYMVFFLDPL